MQKPFFVHSQQKFGLLKYIWKFSWIIDTESECQVPFIINKVLDLQTITLPDKLSRRQKKLIHVKAIEFQRVSVTLLVWEHFPIYDLAQHTNIR